MKARRVLAVSNLALAALLMLVVWMLLVWVGSRPALKVLWDLTPQHVNSVDRATVELLEELRSAKTAVRFHLFFPPMQGGGQTEAEQQGLAIRTRLRDLTRLLLRRYQWHGGNLVTVDEPDFYTDSATTRELAQRFDYKSAELDTLVVALQPEGRELRYRKLSLLVDLATIDLPAMQANLGPMQRPQVPVLKDFKGEEQISSALKSLLVQGTPVAYFLRSYSPDLDFEGAGSGAYSGFQSLLQHAGFEVRALDLRATEGRVPPDASLVIVLEPRSEFTDRDAQALFDYVHYGGRLFLNYAWAGLADWNPTGGKLGELLGYELSAAPVFHMILDSARAGRPIDGPGVEKLQVQGNVAHPVTRRFVTSGRPLELGAARALGQRRGDYPGIRREELLSTGDQAWIAGIDPRDGLPDRRRPGPGVELRPFVVGLSIAVDVADATARPLRDGAPRTGEVIVVSGLFCNNAGVRLFGDLALNICNWMAERRVLMDIQGSRYEARHLQLSPQQLDRVGSLLVTWVPGTFLLLGFVVFFVRRRI